MRTWEPLVPPQESKEEYIRRIERAIEKNEQRVAYKMAYELLERKYLLGAQDLIVLSVAYYLKPDLDSQTRRQAADMWHRGVSGLERNRQYETIVSYGILIAAKFRSNSEFRLAHEALRQARRYVGQLSPKSASRLAYNDAVEQYARSSGNISQAENLLVE